MISKILQKISKKYSLAILLTVSPVYAGLDYGQINTPLVSRRYLDNNGGLINHISPMLVPPRAASAIENITMDDRGDLIKRNGYSVLQSTNALGSPNTNNITGAGFHNAATGFSFIAVVVGSDVYRSVNNFSGISYSKVTGSVSITNSATNLAQKTDFNDAAIFCNDLDLPFYVNSTGNALAISTNTISAAKTCTTYGNYWVIGNTTESGTSFPTRVRWSDINNQNSLPQLNFIDVEPNDGDKIISMISFDESVYIFKQRSIYRMIITGGSGANAFIIRPLVRNLGAWSKMSVKVIPNVGIVFLAQNTVYLLNDNGLTPIGDKIQRTFDAIQRSQWANSVGEVYPKKYQYWLATSSTSSNSNNEILIYDYVQENWTLYTGINASMLAQATSSTGDNVLFSGDYNATTYLQDNGTSDNPRGISTNITGTYTTGELFTDTYDLKKQFKYLYLVTAGDHNYTTTLNVAYDLNMNYESTQSINVGSTAGIYDTAIYDTDVFAAGNNTITRFELNREAKTVRLQFIQSDKQGSFGIVGWSIVYSNEDFVQ